MKRIKCASFSRKGVREVNQDSVYAGVRDHRGILVVADGMGGHSDGEIASHAVTETLQKWWEAKDGYSVLQEDVKRCEELLYRVNQSLYAEYAAQGRVCGTTVAVMLLDEQEYRTISAGDSHIYRREDRGLELLTVDDVWENRPENLVAFTEAERMADPRYGKLTAAVGAQPNISLQVYGGALAKKELFLLCSDGVYKYCGEANMEKVIRAHQALGPEAMAHALERLAYRMESQDNYSAIVCTVR